MDEVFWNVERSAHAWVAIELVMWYYIVLFVVVIPILYGLGLAWTKLRGLTRWD